ncbi:MAG: LWR-salt protein [Halanaeroarchaeum sp.]
MEARYVFAVTFRLEPEPGVGLDPDTFETRLSRPAATPGEAGWRFFRDNLWRGEIADRDHFREITEAAIGATVLDVDYRFFEADEEYLTALRESIAADLADFKDDSVERVSTKYFGSSIEVA